MSNQIKAALSSRSTGYIIEALFATVASVATSQVAVRNWQAGNKGRAVICLLFGMFWANRSGHLVAGALADQNDLSHEGSCAWECESEGVIPVQYNDETIVVCSDHEQAVYQACQANSGPILV